MWDKEISKLLKFSTQMTFTYQQRLSKNGILDETEDDPVSLNVLRKFGFRIIVYLFGGDHRMLRCFDHRDQLGEWVPKWEVCKGSLLLIFS
ncbi:hypothetical protein TB2_023328 [Malus domestica]